MKITVVGIGKVGYTVSEQLSLEMHDVTVVDINEKVLSDALSSLDVIGVCGNGVSHRILSEAGISECDLLIALTGSDEMNLLCCLIARKLGAKGAIARVRNPEYSEELELIQDSMGLSMAVNPEYEASCEILHLLKYPSAMSIDVFSKGKIDLVSFVANKNCRLCHRSIKDSFAQNGENALICAVERGDQIFIPSGDFIIEEGDTVAAVVSSTKIPEFFRSVGLPNKKIKNVLIIGGGRIAHYLAVELGRRNMNITIIEKERAVAEKLSFLLPEANIICGDGTSRSILVEEGLSEMDAICCLTGFDEENILLSLYAKSVSPKIKLITKVNRIAFQEVIRNLDMGSVIYPKYTTANLIVQHVRAKQNTIGSSVETLYKIIDNKVEALEFRVGSDSALVGKTLEELPLKQNVLIASISRNGEVFIPHGSDSLKTGDLVIIVTTISGLSELDDIRG